MSFWNKLQTHLHEAVKAAEATAKDAAAVAKDAAAVVKSEYKQTFEDQFTQIFEVIPGKLIVMEYPMGEKIHKLSARLNSKYGDSYMVYNMSEHGYDSSLFRGEVTEVRFRGLPSPPLEMFFRLMIEAKQWIDAGHCLVVHCFSGYTRSAMFCACYLYWSCYTPSTSRALDFVCKRLSINATEILPTQKRYIDYFERVLTDGPVVNRRGKYITRVLITGIPNFLEEGIRAPPSLEGLFIEEDPLAVISSRFNSTMDKFSQKIADAAPKEGAPGGANGKLEKGTLFSALASAQTHWNKLSEKAEQKLIETGWAEKTPADPKNLAKPGNPNEGGLHQHSSTSTTGEDPATPADKDNDPATPAANPNSQERETASSENSSTKSTSAPPSDPIFVPYLEVWHREKLLYSSWNSLDLTTAPANSYQVSDSCVPFSLKSKTEGFLCPPLDGDVLLRVRHFDAKTGCKISAFRLGFNTNYIPGTNFLHFPNSGLDTAAREFPADGFVDLFFEDAGGAMKSDEEIKQGTVVFERAKNIFETTKEEEAQRQREQMLAEKQESSSSGGGGSKAHSSKTDETGEEEFARLQEKLGIEGEYDLNWSSPSSKGGAGGSGASPAPVRSDDRTPSPEIVQSIATPPGSGSERASPTHRGRTSNEVPSRGGGNMESINLLDMEDEDHHVPGRGAGVAPTSPHSIAEAEAAPPRKRPPPPPPPAPQSAASQILHGGGSSSGAAAPSLEDLDLLGDSTPPSPKSRPSAAEKTAQGAPAPASPPPPEEDDLLLFLDASAGTPPDAVSPSSNTNAISADNDLLGAPREDHRTTTMLNDLLGAPPEDHDALLDDLLLIGEPSAGTASDDLDAFLK